MKKTIWTILLALLVVTMPLSCGLWKGTDDGSHVRCSDDLPMYYQLYQICLGKQAANPTVDCSKDLNFYVLLYASCVQKQKENK